MLRLPYLVLCVTTCAILPIPRVELRPADRTGPALHRFIKQLARLARTTPAVQTPASPQVQTPAAPRRVVVRIFRNTSSRLPHDHNSTTLHEQLSEALKNLGANYQLDIAMIVVPCINSGGESIVVYSLPNDYSPLPAHA